MGITTSLISLWEFEEASGTRADAVVASGNDLTDNATVTRATGKVGFAAQFTRANSEYLSRADNASLSTADEDFSIACWIYLDNTGLTQAIAGRYTGSANTSAMLLYVTTANKVSLLADSGGSEGQVIANTFGALSISTWYFVVATHDATANTINLSVNDGVMDAAAWTLGTNDVTVAWNIGAYNNGAGFFDGRIDQIGFWKKVLSAADITWLYNAGTGRSYADMVAFDVPAGGGRTRVRSNRRLMLGYGLLSKRG